MDADESEIAITDAEGDDSDTWLPSDEDSDSDRENIQPNPANLDQGDRAPPEKSHNDNDDGPLDALPSFLPSHNMGMGNSQSQASDDEDGPRYNYHEQVLREAQNAATNIIDAGDVASDDEQYFSAEEGDSVRSVTPPRTRPESSSGEDFSDSENNSENEEGEQEVAVITQESPSVGHTNLRPNLRSQRSCGQCNVSTFQEHDSILAEVQTARGRSSNSTVSSASTARQSEDHSFTIRGSRTSHSFSNQSAKQNSSSINPSPFVPIQPPSNTRRETSPISGKRKLARGSESPRGDLALPKKRLATRPTTKRKRLGYFESSESASETEPEGEKRTPRKREKLSKSTSKKKSQRDDSSDSDEKRYRKTRRTQLSRRDDESESDESSRERRSARGRNSQKERGDYRSPRKGRSRKSSEGSSEHSHDRSAGRRQRKSRQQNSESDEEVEEDRKASQRSERQRNRENNGTENLQTANTNAQIQQHQKAKQVQNPTETNTATVPCHTLKMGEHSMRNAQGKVFPVRQQDQGSLQNESSTEPPHVPITNLSNIMEHLRPRHSAFKAPSNVTLKRKAAALQEVDDSGDSLHVSPDQVMKNTQNSISNAQIHKSKNLSQEENVNVSPLRNVVLTPSKSPTTGNHLLHHASDMQMSVSDDSDSRKEKSMDMEVDETDASMDFQTDPPSQAPAVGIRSFLKGRRRGKTAAERLKNFWSEKKKDIKSNLKSLFSKTTSPSTKATNLSDLSWQSVVSSFSNNSSAHFSPKDISSGHAHSASPVTYLSSEGFGGPAFTSSPEVQSFTQHPAPRISSLSSLLNSSTSPIFHGVSPQSQHTGDFKGPIAQNSEQPNGRLSNSRLLRSGSIPTRISPRLRSGTPRGQQKHVPAVSPPRTNARPSVEHLPQMSQFQVLNCQLGGILQLSVSMGDISEQSTAGIINWTDGALTHVVTECSRHIAARAGALMRAGCNDYIENKGAHLEAPDVLTTPAGGKFDHDVEAILHVVAPLWLDGNEARNSHNLMEVYANCLRFAEERLGLESLSFPLIANGIFPSDLCIQAFFDALLIFMAEHAASSQDFNLSNVQLVITDPSTTDLAADMIQSRLESITLEGLDNVTGAIFNNYLSAAHQNRVEVDRAASGRPRVKRPRL